MLKAKATGIIKVKKSQGKCLITVKPNQKKPVRDA